VRARTIVANTSAGDVTLAADAPLERLDATTSAGDVRLLVPDVAYRLHTETSAGDTDTGAVSTSDDAPREISAVTSAGDIRIETRR
jgi:DUF4097 and DUF4098 domain-containing protein YvlB